MQKNRIKNYSQLDIQNNKCKHGIDHEYPLSYRLKPLWLIGLLPYPDLYDLEITLSDSSKYNFIYGLNYEKYKNSSSNKIIIPDIDVTVPFFIVENLGFKNGIEIVWNKSKLSDNEISFNIYKFNTKITGYLNRVEYNQVNIKYNNDDCTNDRLLNYKETKTLTIKYEWKKSTSKMNDEHLKRIKPYNDAIIKLRTQKPEITTRQLLSNLNQLNEYQSMLLCQITSTK